MKKREAETIAPATELPRGVKASCCASLDIVRKLSERYSHYFKRYAEQFRAGRRKIEADSFEVKSPRPSLTCFVFTVLSPQDTQSKKW